MRKAVISIGVFLWCAGAQADETILSPADLEAVRHKIEGNWNTAPVSQSACSQVIVLRINLGAGGTVEEIKLLDPEPLPQSCHQAADSAKRAILISSPLPVPNGVEMLQMNFDPTKLQ